MEILMVQFNIKPDRVDDFLAASADDGRGSVSHEYGCHRFDVIQNDSDPNRVAFCEVYDDHAAVENHLTMSHFKTWRDATKEMIDGEVKVSTCRNLFPNDYAEWDAAIPGVDESFFSGNLHVIHAPRLVLEDKIDAYIEASLGDALGSTGKEQGCLRFDLYQTIDNPAELWLYEVYVNEAAFQYHTTTPHIKEWRDAVADWYAEPATGAVRGSNYWPPDDWGWSSGRPKA